MDPGTSASTSGLRKITGRKSARWAGVQELKAQRREAILQSVATVLRNSQMSSFTMEDIADELGITKGNLYYYFKNKQEILFHCHMRSIEISLRALDVAQAHRGPPSERLRVLLTGHIRGSIEDGFGGRLQTDLEDMRSDQRRLYVRKRDELELAVRRLIEEGVRAGEFDCPNVKLAGFAILGAINWMPKWYRPSGRYAPAQIAEEMVDYFLRGLMRTSDEAKSSNAKQRWPQGAAVRSRRVIEKVE